VEGSGRKGDLEACCLTALISLSRSLTALRSERSSISAHEVLRGLSLERAENRVLLFNFLSTLQRRGKTMVKERKAELTSSRSWISRLALSNCGLGELCADGGQTVALARSARTGLD